MVMLYPHCSIYWLLIGLFATGQEGSSDVPDILVLLCNKLFNIGSKSIIILIYHHATVFITRMRNFIEIKARFILPNLFTDVSNNCRVVSSKGSYGKVSCVGQRLK